MLKFWDDSPKYGRGAETIFNTQQIKLDALLLTGLVAWINTSSKLGTFSHSTQNNLVA
jgi:hypothetical protein